ncbi:MAG: MFS transporter [Flavobacteriales bacterium]
MTETALSRKKIQNGWAMYDWANSVYNLVIGSTIFPIFYDVMTSVKNSDGVVTSTKVKVFGSTLENTELISYATAFGLTIVCLVLPILSGVADYYGKKKFFLKFFCYLGSLSCMSLYFFDPAKMELSILSVILACIGFWGSYAFSNSFLPIVATEDEQDKLSAEGFSLGYLGSMILLICALVAVMVIAKSGPEKVMMMRYSFIAVGVWWMGFAQITFSRLKESERVHAERTNVFTKGFSELGSVLKQLKHLPQLKAYLLAFFTFSMGIQTIMQMATYFGKKEVKLETLNLIVAIILVQIIAIPGAYLFSKLSNRIGNFSVLKIALALWMFICFFAFFFVQEGQVMMFYIVAGLIGFIMGGTQSLARSTYSKLIPGTKDTASFFSFYDVTEKVGLIIGLVSFGFIEGKFSMRYSILALIVFFVIGFGLMFLIPKNKAEG